MRDLISEAIFKSLLFEAKTPEEILEIIKYKYSEEVPEKFIEKVFNIDPTKKKSFTRWVCEMYPNDEYDLEDDYKDGTLKELFVFYKKNSDKFSLSDMKTLDDAKSYAFTFDLEDVVGKNGDGPENDFEYKDVDNVWGVAKYNTYEASKKLGKDCIWCTANAYGNGEGYYDDYTSNGEIFILFKKNESEECKKKKYTFKRYQIFFPNEDSRKSPEFNDSENYGVLPKEIGFTDALYKFFESIGFTVNNIFMSEETRMERYGEWRIDNILEEFKIKCINGRVFNFYLMPEYENNYDIRENPDYFLYEANDLTEPIEDDIFGKKDDFEEGDFFITEHFVVFRNTYSDFGFILSLYSDDEDYFVEYVNNVKHLTYNETSGIKYFIYETYLGLEKGNNFWALNSNPNEISSIEFINEAENCTYTSVLTNSYTFLLRLEPNSKYSILKYAENGCKFDYRNGKFVATKDANEDETLDHDIIEGSYAPDEECGETGQDRYILCAKQFFSGLYCANIYDTKKKKMLFGDYYTDCWVFGRFYVLYHYGTSEYPYVNDIFDTKSGTLMVRGCKVENGVHYENVKIFRSKEEIFIVNQDYSKGVYRGSDIIGTVLPILFIKTNNDKILVFDERRMSWIDEAESFKLFERCTCYYKTKSGALKLLSCNGSKGTYDIYNLGAADFEPKMITDARYNPYIIFKRSGDDKLSLFSVLANQVILNNDFFETEEDMNTTRFNKDLILLRKNNGWQLYNLFRKKYLCNGYGFFLKGGSICASEGNVLVKFTYRGDTIIPLSVFVKRGVNYVDFPYGLNILNDEEINVPEEERDVADDLLRLKSKITGQVSEMKVKSFYKLLERMENSKYNFL